MSRTSIPVLPPVSVWGTLLGAKLYIAGTSLRVNTKCAVCDAEAAVSKCVKDVKEKIKTKKAETEVKEESNTEENKETEVKEETKPEEAPEAELDPEKEVTLNFSNAEKAVIYDNPEDEEVEERPVTQEDLDAIMAKTNLSSNKKSK